MDELSLFEFGTGLIVHAGLNLLFKGFPLDFIMVLVLYIGIVVLLLSIIEDL